jgi:tetratricopeptide (TPR) repeat protein
LNSEDVLDMLAHLTRKSLVVADETADGVERYWMLETVRDYARQKLASRGAAELSALRDRHAVFYAAWVEHQVANPQAHWSVAATLGLSVDALRRVEAEFDNIRAMLTWCLDSEQPAPGIRLAIRLLVFWEVRGLYAEARRWLGALLELAEPTARGGRVDGTTLADRAAAAFIIGSCALRQGDYQETRARHDEAIALWRELGDHLPLAVVLAERGLVAWLRGHPAEAMDYLEESRRVFERCDRSNPAIALHATNALRARGMVARAQGDYLQAADCFRESVRLGRLNVTWDGGGYSVARGLCHLGRTVFLQGDVAQAKQVFNEALALIRTERLAGHTLADCLDWLAAVADADGRPRDAAVLYGAADAQWQASGASRYAPERATYAAELASVQAKLSEQEFATAWAEGHALSREQAVTAALDETRV